MRLIVGRNEGGNRGGNRFIGPETSIEVDKVKEIVFIFVDDAHVDGIRAVGVCDPLEAVV